jgi:hypothetical protein
MKCWFCGKEAVAVSMGGKLFVENTLTLLTEYALQNQTQAQSMQLMNGFTM